MLCRTIAFTLICGAGFGYLLQRSGRRLAAFAVGTLALVLPWTLYSALQGGGSIGYYVHQFRTEFSARTPVNHLKTIVMQDAPVFLVPALNTNAVSGVLGRLHLGWAVPLLGAFLTLLILTGAARLLRARDLMAWAMVPYTLLIIVWPWTPERFILPVLPFYVVMLFEGVSVVSAVSRAARRGRGEGPAGPPTGLRGGGPATVLAGGVLVSILGGVLVDVMWLRNALATGHHGGAASAAHWRAIQQGLRAIREQTPPDALVLSSYSAGTHLFTKRATLQQPPAAEMPAVLKRCGGRPLYVFMTYRESHAEYNTGEDYGMKPVLEFADRYPGALEPLWRNEAERVALYRVLPSWADGKKPQP